MITGDKAETAVAIGRMCGLLKPDHELELLLKLSGQSLRQRLDDLVHFFTKTSRDSTPSQTTISSTITQVLMRTFAPPSSTKVDENKIENKIEEKTRESMIDKTENLLKRERSFRDGEIASSPSTQFLPSHIEEESRSCATSYRSGVNFYNLFFHAHRVVGDRLVFPFGQH